ncbi:tRNA-splicing endonuclease subunit [Arachnomyces sp. PD_36]|nr:tRNA-splicing endonuclease subunit [Arachnomyces sp. PD_36]
MADQPELPIPISLVSDHYLIFSINAVTYLRREYHICGVLSGTLPQLPQQNVFLGLPLQLMPEEARLLVEKGVAYVVDEAKAHNEGMKNLAEEDRRRYLAALEQEGFEASRIQRDRKEVERESALKRIEKKKAAKLARAAEKSESRETQTTGSEEAQSDTLFNDSPSRSSGASSSSRASIVSGAPFGITPATSYPPLTAPPPTTPQSLPAAPPSYPLFAHLHSQGYFLSPGLRFGCQYLAYPGDPLRFHSHFLAVAADWDEEFDLMKIVAGGRLGTGVKKGFLIGGAEKGVDEKDEGKVDNVRTFSIEWAGM